MNTTPTVVDKAPADQMLMELASTKQITQSLMELDHYRKIGAHGVMAIVQMAKSLKIDPLNCLNGALYFQPKSGRIEMSSRLMMQLIRQAKHSVTKDHKSDDSICILHGKRADTSDTWTASFSINDAKKAGIFAHTWERYPSDMCYARALSRLARQLFPDVIQGCYCEGETTTSLNTNQSETVEVECSPSPQKPFEEVISELQYIELDTLIGDDKEYRNDVLKFISKKFNALSLSELPLSLYEKVKAKALKNQRERLKTLEVVDVTAEDTAEVEGE